MRRRTLLRSAATLLFAAIPAIATAQSYPNKPIRIVQGFGPGGNADTIARLIGNEISKTLGQPVVVETRPGAGGNLAAEVVAKAAPDGYSLLLVTGGHSVSGAIYKSLPYDPSESFDMISTVTQFPFLFVVKSDSPYQTLRAVLDAARAKPDAIAYASAGIGSTHHLTGELLAKMSGVPMLHVPYKGDAAAITSLLGGEVPLAVGTPTVVMPQVKAGKLRVLAVSSGSRWAVMPDVPTADEAGVPGFDVRSWTGLATTAGTPRPIVDRLNSEIQRALQLPEVRARIDTLGADTRGSTPTELRDRVATELARWKKVIADSKIPQQ
jgi:tripartite-type tricarboxylate transporter receptor subunit TctC